MRVLAQWAMNSRKQAIFAAMLCFALPLLFWLGSAILALVVLRQGWREGGWAVLWAVLPCIAWFALGEPTPLFVALSTCALATVLRRSVRLDLTVIALIFVGGAAYWFLPAQLAAVMSMPLEETKQAVKSALVDQPEMAEQLVEFVAPMMNGALAALHMLVTILCLLLGRYWQSELYNPNGFGREFKQLRLSFSFCMLTVLAIMAIGQIPREYAGVALILTVPLALAGLAFIHGFVATKKGSSEWLVLIYLALVILGPYTYTLLIFVAVLDSVFNFRSLPKDTAP